MKSDAILKHLTHSKTSTMLHKEIADFYLNPNHDCHEVVCHFVTFDDLTFLITSARLHRKKWQIFISRKVFERNLTSQHTILNIKKKQRMTFSRPNFLSAVQHFSRDCDIFSPSTTFNGYFRNNFIFDRLEIIQPLPDTPSSNDLRMTVRYFEFSDVYL